MILCRIPRFLRHDCFSRPGKGSAPRPPPPAATLGHLPVKVSAVAGCQYNGQNRLPGNRFFARSSNFAAVRRRFSPIFLPTVSDYPQTAPSQPPPALLLPTLPAAIRPFSPVTGVTALMSVLWLQTICTQLMGSKVVQGTKPVTPMCKKRAQETAAGPAILAQEYCVHITTRVAFTPWYFPSCVQN